jgi:hypothetical protein
MTNRKDPEAAVSGGDAKNRGRAALSPAAKRALAEAAERRAKRAAEAAEAGEPAKEIDGVDGPEPVRYGDWENKGRASDF